MRSCERPRKRSVNEALPSSVSKRYAFSIRTHGNSCRRCASSSLRRVSSFSAASSSRRAVSHSSRVPMVCVSIVFSPFSDTFSVAVRKGESDKCVGIPMDSLITAAARALAAGDPLGALKRVALREDAPALALRGIAMAQLGDLVRARALLRRSAHLFGPREAVARARCVVAEAEIALVSRDLGWSGRVLDAARATLEDHGDHANAAHAQHLDSRRLLLIGRLDEAERALARLDPSPLSPAARTVHELVAAGIARS